MSGLVRRDVLTGAAALLWPLPAAAANVRLRVAADRIFLPAAINGRAVEALLDSAAEVSVVDSALAAQLGLRPHRNAIARGSGQATVEAQLVAGVTLAVAGLTLHPEHVAILDLGDISRRLTRAPIQLILGRELFDAARLAIDIAGATLTVTDRAGTPPGARLPLTMRRGIETVPCRIEGLPANADFDIGNGGRVLIGQAFAARHRLLADGRPTARIGGGGIGGEAWQTAFTLRSLELAGVRLTDVPVAIDASDSAADANIGLSVLRRFGIVTDFAERAVWLNPS